MKTRTIDERNFDWGVKGWAFMGREGLEKLIPVAEALYSKLGDDKERKDTLERIKQAARRGLPKKSSHGMLSESDCFGEID